MMQTPAGHGRVELTKFRRPKAAADCLSRQSCVALRDSPRETLANLSITGHLCCFSDQPVAEIVQCGEPLSSIEPIREPIERLDVGQRKTSAIELRVRYDC
jgi:hypothetical protein